MGRAGGWMWRTLFLPLFDEVTFPPIKTSLCDIFLSAFPAVN